MVVFQINDAIEHEKYRLITRVVLFNPFKINNGSAHYIIPSYMIINISTILIYEYNFEIQP